MGSLIKVAQMGDEFCGGDIGCPTIYRDAETGAFIIQGFVLDSIQRDQLGMPAGEDAVCVPNALVQRLADVLRAKE